MSQRPPQPTRELAACWRYQDQLAHGQATAQGSFRNAQAGVHIEASKNGHQYFNTIPAVGVPQSTVLSPQQLLPSSDTIDIDSLLAHIEDPKDVPSSSLANVKTPEAHPNLPMDALIHRLSAVDRQLQELKRCQSERIRRQHKQIGRITADLRGTERVMNELPYSFSSGGSSVGDGDR